MNILVTGSLGYDYIMNFSGRFADRIMPEKMHKISLSFLADKLNKQFGGTAGNIAYSLKLLGVDPQIISVAGNDFLPYKEFLLSKYIDVSHISIYEKEPTSCYFVVTDTDNNQIGTFYVGAQKYASKLSLATFLQGDPLEKFVVISPQDPTSMKKFVRECQDLKLPYLYDPAFQIATFTKSELREGITGAEILIGNDYEIDLITNTLDISHEELLVIGPKVVITTLGSKGSIIESRNDAIHIKPAKVKKTSDPTGAGDAYRGGFLAGYLKGYDLSTCGQMGSVAAVYTVEKYGTVTHHFTKQEFIRRYKENYNQAIEL